jgi:threonylcarbamoyladenosine tRNA methylthiotransferase MtaB
MEVLRTLAAEKTQAHRLSFVGRGLEAITLCTPPDEAARGRSSALTENFLPMALNGTITANRLIRVRWTVLNRDGMLEAIEMKPLLVHGSAKPGQCYT